MQAQQSMDTNTAKHSEWISEMKCIAPKQIEQNTIVWIA